MTDRIKEIENLLPDRLKTVCFQGCLVSGLPMTDWKKSVCGVHSRQKSGLRERITGQTK